MVGLVPGHRSGFYRASVYRILTFDICRYVMNVMITCHLINMGATLMDRRSKTRFHFCFNFFIWLFIRCVFEFSFGYPLLSFSACTQWRYLTVQWCWNAHCTVEQCGRRYAGCKDAEVDVAMILLGLARECSLD